MSSRTRQQRLHGTRTLQKFSLYQNLLDYLRFCRFWPGSGPVLDRFIPRKQIIPPRQQRQLQRDKDGFIRTDHSSVAGNRHDVSQYPPVTGTRRARTRGRQTAWERALFFLTHPSGLFLNHPVGRIDTNNPRHKSINVSCLILQER